MRLGTEWNGDKYTYIVNMMDDSPDSGIEALHSFLVSPSGITTVDSDPWLPEHVKLFVSHLAIHKAFVGEVRQVLPAINSGSSTHRVSRPQDIRS
jgi:hypothetical protein